MKKRIIFDIDNTLINWEEEYDSITFTKTLQKYNIKESKELIKKLSDSINSYEKEYSKFSKINMIKKINRDLNFNFGIDFLEEWLENVNNFATPNKAPSDIEDILEYLSKKYELVALTNWFEKYQEKRLEKYGILKYFKKVYGTEEIIMKPHPESFEKAIGNHKIQECIMIGDSIENDIKGAINIGMDAILVNNKNTKIKIKNCKVINKIIELKEIL